jgi:shikimate kinase
MKNFHNFTAMRIYLIGYMASGKSNFGRLLAEHLGFVFLDLDCLFEQRFRISVIDFFTKYDEAGFRKIEQSLLHETRNHDDVVIATGGGTPCFFDNMQFIRESGISVYLQWEISALIDRLRNVKLKRPLLQGIPAAELEERVSMQIDQRKSYYELADITVDGANLNLEKIIGLIRNRSEWP